MVAINVIFENPNKFYFEGETVRIRLEIKLEKPSSLDTVVANFVGLSEIVHGDSKARGSGRGRKEIYFDDVLPVFTDNSKDGDVRPSGGIHAFALAYLLPDSLPTSIESSSGFVRYSVHVRCTDNGGETFKKTEHFTVVARTDLNKDDSARLPGVKWQPENQCILQAVFCRGTQIRGFLHIPKRGYVPGECLFINAEIRNFSRRPIEWAKACLVQVLQFNDSKAFKEKRVVTELARGCILPFDTQIWRSESILIPAIPPTTYSPKRLVSVKYKLLFQYKPSWLKKEIELKQKIIIGTVRLVTFGLGQGEGRDIYSSELFNGSNLDPCIFGPHLLKRDGDGDGDDGGETCQTFSPLYPIHVESQ